METPRRRALSSLARLARRYDDRRAQCVCTNETRPPGHAVEDAVGRVQGGVVMAVPVYKNSTRQGGSLRVGEQQGPSDITDLQKAA